MTCERHTTRKTLLGDSTSINVAVKCSVFDSETFPFVERVIGSEEVPVPPRL